MAFSHGAPDSAGMRRAFGRLCLVVISVAAALGLSEALVRIFAPHVRDAALPGQLFAIDTELGWKLVPSRSATHRSRYFRAEYTINSNGFRDRPRTRLAADHVRRVLLYGDSLVFGWGLNEGERFSDLLEMSQHGLEVLNHAIPGYGLDQEVILYEREGDSLDADEVVFFVATSTISRLDTGFIYSKYKPRFIRRDGGGLALVHVPERRAALVGLIYETLSPLYLPYFVESEIAKIRGRPTGGEGGDQDLRHGSRPLVDDLAKSLLQLAWMTAQRRGHRMTILLAELSQADRHQLRGLCRETGIACVETAINFAGGANANDTNQFVFGADDRHWNARANTLVADQLRGQLMR